MASVAELPYSKACVEYESERTMPYGTPTVDSATFWRLILTISVVSIGFDDVIKLRWERSAEPTLCKLSFVRWVRATFLFLRAFFTFRFLTWKLTSLNLRLSMAQDVSDFWPGRYFIVTSCIALDDCIYTLRFKAWLIWLCTGGKLLVPLFKSSAKLPCSTYMM